MNLLTIRQAAEILNLSRQFIWMNLDKFGAVDIRNGQGKRRLLRIPEESLKRYIASCAVSQNVQTVRHNKTWSIERKD